MKPSVARGVIWVSLGCAAGALGWLGLWQNRRAAELRAERDRLVAWHQERRRDLARQRAEIDARDSELARLRRDIEEVGRARKSLALLERALASESGELVAPVSVEKPMREALPTLRGPMLKSAAWRDAGAATPEAALESFVWAATRGETERLGALLVMDDAGREELGAAFAKLSSETQAAYGTPDQMLATLIAVQVPQDLSAIGGGETLNLSNGDIVLRARTERGGTMTKDAVLTFRLADGGWRLVVPREITSAALAAVLKTSASARQ